MQKALALGKALLFALAALLLFSCTDSQTYSVSLRGRIKDAHGKPFTGAQGTVVMRVFDIHDEFQDFHFSVQTDELYGVFHRKIHRSELTNLAPGDKSENMELKLIPYRYQAKITIGGATYPLYVINEQLPHDENPEGRVEFATLDLATATSLGPEQELPQLKGEHNGEEIPPQECFDPDNCGEEGHGN